MSCVQKLRDDGWRFQYEPGTEFVGASHPKGGKFSVCGVCPNPSRGRGFQKDIGDAIASFLNGERDDGARDSETDQVQGGASGGGEAESVRNDASADGRREDQAE